MTDKEALKLALEALEKSIGMLERADCSTGYCCCGSSVDDHTFGDGHSPVDEGEYYQGNALEYASKAITAIKQALAAPVQDASKQFHEWAVSEHATLTTAPPAHPAPVQEQVAVELERIAQEPPVNGNNLAQARVLMAAQRIRNTTPPAAKRQWVRLSEDDIDEIFNNHPTYQLDHFVFAEDVMSKYEEKNAAAQLVVPDFLNAKDENPAYAAGWNDCRAEMLKWRSQ